MSDWQKALRFWPWLAAITSGLLCVACFPPFDQAWLCWFALTPLIAAVWFSDQNSRRRWLRNLLLGYVAGVVFFTGTFGWLSSLGTLFGNFLLHGLPFLLSLYLAIYFAFWSWFIGSMRPSETAASEAEPPSKWDEMLARAGKPVKAAAPSSPWLRSTSNLRLAFCVASAWTALEWIRGWLFSGFNWNNLGVALHTNWPIIQIAEFTGVAGLSFAVAFANVIAITTSRRLIIEARTHRMRPHYDLTLTMSAIVGLLAYGIHASQTKQPSTPVRIAAVQANVPQPEKFDPQFRNKTFERYTRLSEIATKTSPPPDLLIWPESSMPGPVLEDDASNRFVMDLVRSTNTDLLLGSVDVQEPEAYNAALLISPGAQDVQIYRKVHLVPFGEYIPLRQAFPLFAAAAGRWVQGDFTPGSEFTVFEIKNAGVRIAPLICFEDTDGELTRKFVLNGANLLVNVTNDGWFLHSAGSQVHLVNSIFRCVETRRPMARAANTGVTCFVNEFGRIMQRLQDETGSTFTEGVLTGTVDVPVERSLTFYVRHGELFAKLCACATLAAIALRALQCFRQRKAPGKIEG